MFREIDAECYIMVDGNDMYPAEAAPEMVRNVLEKNSDMVVGDRPDHVVRSKYLSRKL